MLALTRQRLPALIHGWGDSLLSGCRAERVERMRAVLVHGAGIEASVSHGRITMGAPRGGAPR